MCPTAEALACPVAAPWIRLMDLLALSLRALLARPHVQLQVLESYDTSRAWRRTILQSDKQQGQCYPRGAVYAVDRLCHPVSRGDEQETLSAMALSGSFSSSAETVFSHLTGLAQAGLAKVLPAPGATSPTPTCARRNLQRMMENGVPVLEPSLDSRPSR
ncbi:hypothetical protein LZ30DRAFT_718406 [Colletotrichum cereale]|nr:hypothetical protein LZ30DRAFT_718406 [Colletotrichum cereale]